MPPKKRTSQKVSIMKDGHGAHWHVLLWIITVTVFLSTVVMLYSAWAFSGLGKAEPTATDKRVERRLDKLESRLGTVESAVLEIKAMMEEDAAMENEAMMEAEATSTLQ
jgi:hypothetical protein